SSPVAFLVLSLAIVFPTVAVGLLVAGISKSREQTQPLSLALVMVLSGLGGLWWPQSIQPEWMQSFSPVVYTTWAMQGMNDLVLRARGRAALAQPVLVLFSSGLLVRAVGLRLFRTRHSAR